MGQSDEWFLIHLRGKAKYVIASKQEDCCFILIKTRDINLFFQENYNNKATIFISSPADGARTLEL